MRASHARGLRACLLLPTCGTALAQATLLVPAQYPTIQAAIVAASPGDTVLVAAGVYAERIDFLGKAIAVRGAAGAGATTIDANQLGTAVTFAAGEPATAVLEGFTVRGGLGVTAAGGGIQCSFASPTIRACVITANQGRPGTAGGAGGAGGIHASGSALRLFDCEVSANVGGDGGSSAAGAGGNGGAGGIFVATMTGSGAPPPIVERCRIGGNRGGNGGLGVVPGPAFGRGGPGGLEMFSYASSTALRACVLVGNYGGGGGTGNGGAGGFDVYGPAAFAGRGAQRQVRAAEGLAPHDLVLECRLAGDGDTETRNAGAVEHARGDGDMAQEPDGLGFSVPAPTLSV